MDDLNKYYSELDENMISNAIEKYLDCLDKNDIDEIYKSNPSIRRINENFSKTIIQMATLFALANHGSQKRYNEFCDLLVSESRKDNIYMINMRIFYLENLAELAEGNPEVEELITNFRDRYYKIAQKKMKLNNASKVIMNPNADSNNSNHLDSGLEKDSEQN